MNMAPLVFYLHKKSSWMTCIDVNEENNHITQLLAIGQSYENVGASPERQKALICYTDREEINCKRGGSASLCVLQNLASLLNCSVHVSQFDWLCAWEWMFGVLAMWFVHWLWKYRSVPLCVRQQKSAEILLDLEHSNDVNWSVWVFERGYSKVGFQSKNVDYVNWVIRDFHLITDFSTSRLLGFFKQRRFSLLAFETIQVRTVIPNHIQIKIIIDLTGYTIGKQVSEACHVSFSPQVNGNYLIEVLWSSILKISQHLIQDFIY